MISYERNRALVRSLWLTWQVLVHGNYHFVYDRIPIRMTGMSTARRWNLFRSGFNLMYRRTRPWNMPLHMQFELTNTCTLHCPVCPTGSRKMSRPPKMMNPELFRQVLEEVGPYLLTMSLWGWGESLLHPQLSEFLAQATKYPVFSLLSTNGQKLDVPGIQDALIRFPPDHLIVALDGLSDETNSRFRIGARLEPALAGVRKLAEIKQRIGAHKPVLHMRYIVMKHNQHEVPHLTDFAQDAGFDFLSVRTLFPIASTDTNSLYEALLPDESNYRAFEYRDGRRVESDNFICTYPYWFPSLFADGTVVPCDQDYDATEAFGLIRANDPGSFIRLWYGKHAREIRARLQRDSGISTFCCNCPFRDRPTTHGCLESRILHTGLQVPFMK